LRTKALIPVDAEVRCATERIGLSSGKTLVSCRKLRAEGRGVKMEKPSGVSPSTGDGLRGFESSHFSEKASRLSLKGRPAL